MVRAGLLGSALGQPDVEIGQRYTCGGKLGSLRAQPESACAVELCEV